MVDCRNEAKLSNFNWYNVQIKIHISLIWLVVLYKVVHIWPGLFVCKQTGYSPGHIWTTLYMCESLLSQITGILYAKFVWL